MRKRDRPVGEEEKRGAEENNAASLFSSLSRKETPFLARSRGSAYSSGRQLRHRRLCSSRKRQTLCWVFV